MSDKKKDKKSEQMIFCACGCGQLIPKYDKWRRERRFVKGHHGRKIPSKSFLMECGEKGLKPREIADAIGCTDRAVWQSLKSHNILELFHKKRLYQKREFVDDLYTYKGLRSREVAKICNCGHGTILKWLKIHDIPIKPSRPPRHIEIHKELYEVLSGELLGDGCIATANGLSAYYVHSTNKPDYLQWLFTLLSSFGLEWNGKIYESKPSGKSPYPSFNAKTFSYRELIQIRNEFYPSGIKIVPPNLQITPKTLLHWFLGDGSFTHQNSSYRLGRIVFSTQGFSFDDVCILTSLLKEIGIEGDIRESNGKLYIDFSKYKHISRFFEYIEPCPKEIVDIYGYKFLKQQNATLF